MKPNLGKRGLIGAAVLATSAWLVPLSAWAGTAPAAPVPDSTAPPMTDIHDIKPALPVPPDLTWLWWVLAAILFIALVALMWWLWRKRRRPEPERPTKPLPSPEVEAYARLDALATDLRLDDKQYYFRLSAILRHYVERRYSFPAAEMTLEELLPHMAQLPIPESVRQPFQQFCRSSEPIKFADAPADPVQKPKDLAFAKDFVRATTPVETTEGVSKN